MGILSCAGPGRPHSVRPQVRIPAKWPTQFKGSGPSIPDFRAGPGTHLRQVNDGGRLTKRSLPQEWVCWLSGEGKELATLFINQPRQAPCHLGKPLGVTGVRVSSRQREGFLSLRQLSGPRHPARRPQPPGPGTPRTPSGATRTGHARPRPSGPCTFSTAFYDTLR